MKWLLFLNIVFLGTVCFTYGQVSPIGVTCPPNKIWVSCTSGCSLEPTCSSYLSGATPSCSSNCVPGCKCISGLLKTPSGGCMTPNGCCGDPNAVIAYCSSQCPGTCLNPTPTYCLSSCTKYRCVCKSGYVLDAYGKCIPRDMCPSWSTRSTITRSTTTTR